MSGRLAVARRAVLTMLGVASASLALLLSLTELAIGVQGDRTAPWIALVFFIGTIVLGWLTLWAASGRNPCGRRVTIALSGWVLSLPLATIAALRHLRPNPDAGPALILPFLFAWGADAGIVLVALYAVSMHEKGRAPSH